VQGDQLQHFGSRKMRVFKCGEEAFEMATGDDLNFLMKK
jgi:hypothetical protein